MASQQPDTAVGMPAAKIAASELASELRYARYEGREHFFDAFLTCRHPDFGSLTTDLAARIASVSPPRQRARRKADAETHARLIEAIGANLAYAVTAGIGLVAVPLRRPEGARSRYERGGFRGLADTVKHLTAAGVVRLEVSRERGHASTFAPTPWLINRLRQLAGLNLASFGHAPDEETIILARTTVNRITEDRNSERIDYEDTEETRRFRAEMQRINEHLAAADIRYEGPRVDSIGRLIDASPRSRFLHRTFNIPAPSTKPGEALPPVEPHEKRFDRGGRLYHAGVFWQGLSSNLRLFIRIDGELVAYLDWKSLFLRLAHIETGLEPPPGDLYLRVAGIKEQWHRDGIKAVVNAMLFRDNPLQRLPKGVKHLLPPGLQSASAVRSAILRAFPAALASVFEHGRGFHLMFTESQTLVATLLRLIDDGITALPVHDALMVSAEQAERAEALINETTRERFGFALPLDRK